MGVRALIAGLSVVAATAMAFVPPAQGGAPDPFVISAAKSKDGPYSASRFVELGPGDKRTLWLRVTRRSSLKQTTLHADYFPIEKPGFSLRWFQGDKEITDDVEGLDGRTLKLKPGGNRYISVRAKSETNSSLCASASLRVSDVFVDGASFRFNEQTACI